MFTRCPKAWLGDDARMEAGLFGDWSNLKRHGALPFAGGMAEQTPHFVDAVAVLDGELSRMQRDGVKNGK